MPNPASETPPDTLAGRRIVLGVTGGVAAYKAAELLRLLRKSGADVEVVMTRAAGAFITPLTMQALALALRSQVFLARRSLKSGTVRPP